MKGLYLPAIMYSKYMPYKAYKNYNTNAVIVYHESTHDSHPMVTSTRNGGEKQ